MGRLQRKFHHDHHHHSTGHRCHSSNSGLWSVHHSQCPLDCPPKPDPLLSPKARKWIAHGICTITFLSSKHVTDTGLNSPQDTGQILPTRCKKCPKHRKGVQTSYDTMNNISISWSFHIQVPLTVQKLSVLMKTSVNLNALGGAPHCCPCMLLSYRTCCKTNTERDFRFLPFFIKTRILFRFLLVSDK